MQAGDDRVSLGAFYGGSIATQMDGRGDGEENEVATTYHGWIMEIGGVPDRMENGTARPWYFRPLVSSRRAITYMLAADEQTRLALMFPGQSEQIARVVVDGLQLEEVTATR